ncbi:MAG: DUF2079 domain-containing protein, partial [Brachybacterium tyrofermentans]
HDVQWIHGPNTRVPDCVLSDVYAFSWADQPPADIADWSQETWGITFETVYDDGGFSVACRV